MTKDPAPSGKLNLVQYFRESASTHVDTTRDVTLAPHGATGVLMEIEFENNNAYRSSGPGTVERWVIDREELIKLIKAHGKPV